MEVEVNEYVPCEGSLVGTEFTTKPQHKSITRRLSIDVVGWTILTFHEK